MNYRTYGSGGCLLVGLIATAIFIVLAIVAWQLLFLLWPVFLVLLIVGIVYRIYIGHKMKKRYQEEMKNYTETHQQFTNIHQSNGDVFEAEYTVVDEEKEDKQD